MNERIKELSEQAKKYVDNKWAKEGSPLYPEAHYLFIQQRDEKFAELIVAEATKALWTEECMTSDLALAEYSRNSNRVRDHFGVEA
jgi:hypothetical protein